MSDAQRRDKLPLMNGPTANSWPSFGIRTEKDETREEENPCFSLSSHPSLAFPPNFLELFLLSALIATHSNFLSFSFESSPNIKFYFSRLFYIYIYVYQIFNLTGNLR